MLAASGWGGPNSAAKYTDFAVLFRHFGKALTNGTSVQRVLADNAAVQFDYGHSVIESLEPLRVGIHIANFDAGTPPNDWH